MKIEKTINIEISQADVEEAIVAMIKEQDPAIIVDEITFTPKRNSKESIQVKVDAHFGESNEQTPTYRSSVGMCSEDAPVEEVPAGEVAIAPVDEEAEPKEEEAEEAVPVPEKVTSKTSLFA